MSVVSVSYTHLDVYKRQVQQQGECADKDEEEDRGGEQRPDEALGAVLLLSLIHI